MTTTIIRPNGIHSLYPAWVVTGAATAEGATSDSSDASYVEAAGLSPYFQIVFRLGAVALPAGALVRSITPAVRWLHSNPLGAAFMGLGAETRGTYIARVSVSTGVATVIGAPVSAPYGAKASGPSSWTQADLDELTIGVQTDRAGLRVHELYATVVIALKPTVAVTGPTGSFSGTTSPTVVWTYTPGDDGGPQARYRIRVFTAAQVASPGFSPDTAAAVADTGEVLSNNTQATVALYPGTFRAYVKAAQLIDTVAQWSDWSYSDFTIFQSGVDTSAPAPPLLELAAEPADARNRIELTAAPSGAQLSGTGDYLSTPDTVAVSITGDLDVRALAAADDWTPAAERILASKWGAAGQRSWRLALTTAGTLRLDWSADGTATLSATSTVATGLVDTAVSWVRATIDVNNGAAGRTVNFYLSNDGITWNALGAAVTTAGVTSVFDSTTAVTAAANADGTSAWQGEYRRLRFFAGLAGTDLRADVDLSLWDAVATTVAAITGETWTLTGAPPAAYDDLDHFDVQASTDAVTWVDVRAPSAGIVPVGTTRTIWDAEADNGIPTYYRARAVRTPASVVITGDWGPAAGPVTWTSDDWWLKNPTNPADNRPVDVIDQPDLPRRRPAGVFEPIGRADPVVVTDVRRLAAGSVTFETIDDADRVTLAELLEVNGPVLLQAPADVGWGSRWLVLLDSSTRRLSGVAQDPFRHHPTRFVEVARPSSYLTGWGATYDQLSIEYLTYDDLSAAFATYDEMTSWTG